MKAVPSIGDTVSAISAVSLIIGLLTLTVVIPLVFGHYMSFETYHAIPAAAGKYVPLFVAVAALIALWKLGLKSSLAVVSAICITWLASLSLQDGPCVLYVCSWLLFTVALYVRREDRAIILGLLTYYVIVQSSVAILLFFFGRHQFHTPECGTRASSYFGTPYGVYPSALIGVFCCGTQVLEAQSIITKRILTAGACLCLLAVLLTFSRAACLGLAVASVFLSKDFPRRWRTAIILVGVFILCIVLCVRTGPNQGLLGDRSALGRSGVWMAALADIKVVAPFGAGYESFGRQPRYNDTGALGPLPLDPKNIILDLLLDWGPVGIVLYGVFVITSMRNALEVVQGPWSNDERHIARTFILASISLLVAGLVDTPIIGTPSTIPGTALWLVLSGFITASACDRKVNTSG